VREEFGVNGVVRWSDVKMRMLMMRIEDSGKVEERLISFLLSLKRDLRPYRPQKPG